MRTEPERNEAHLAKGGKIADRADTVLFDDRYPVEKGCLDSGGAALAWNLQTNPSLTGFFT